MSFFEPEIAKPYRSLKYDYAAEDDRVMQDASNQARQIGAQQAARGGFSSPRGVATNTYSRLMGDVLKDRAQRERDNHLKYTQTMAGLPSQPSAISQIGGPLLSGVGYGMGPAIGKGMVSGIGSLWGMGTEGLSSAYNNLRYGYDPAWASASAAAVPAAEYAPEVASTAGDVASNISGFGAGEEATSGLAKEGGNWLTDLLGGIGGWFA